MERYRAFDLNLLIVFDTLLRHGSVSKAAAELGRSQSAISHALARLRDQFGDMLFVKSSDGMIPTDFSLQLREDLRGLICHADSLLSNRASFDPETASRSIRLSLSDMAELAILPRLLPLLRERAPHCTLDIAALKGADLDTALAEGRIDLAISGPLKMAGNVHQQKLDESRFVLLVSDECELSGTVQPADLAPMDEIAVRQASTFRHRLDSLRERIGRVRAPVLVTGHALLIPQMLLGNPHYMAILPLRLAEEYRRTLPLRILDTDFEMPPLYMYQYFHERAKEDAFSIWLRALIRDVVNALPNTNLH